MTALSTAALLARMAERNLKKRLFISPMLVEGEQAKKGQSSIDVRLGFDFCLITASSFEAISEFPNGRAEPETFAKLYRREYVPFGASLVIHPHQFMLAQTLEYIRLPNDLMAYVVGRSTWGRLGLIVATAVGIHPGFSGNLTLELRNLGETPLTLYPGQTIAQLFFHQVVDGNGAPAIDEADNAQYVGTVDMIPQKLSSNLTHAKLKKLISRFEAASKI